MRYRQRVIGVNQSAQLAGSTESKSIRATLCAVLGRWRNRVALLASALAYWLLYSFSSGMFFYYPDFDSTPYLKEAGIPNPYPVTIRGGLRGLYFSGWLWWPNGHLQVNLLYGPSIFSVILSSLFGLSIVLVVWNLRNGILKTKHRPGGSKGSLATLLSFLPALFSGGCCSVPFGAILLGSFLPSAGLSAFLYDYPPVINAVAAIVMLASVLYMARRASKYCPCKNTPSA